MNRSLSLCTLAALEQRHDGPIPQPPPDGGMEALARSMLFDRLARNATLARARNRAQIRARLRVREQEAPDDAADARLARDLRRYRQAGLAWRNLTGQLQLSIRAIGA